ncbi:MAG: sigma-70 family RNA polymerase sigma factor [Chloroflexota bacterium]
MSEKDTVTRAIRGDGEAFAGLYDQYFDKVYRYIYLRLGNHTEAEDLTQEVFVKALEAIGAYRWRNLPFASWLFRIAHNSTVDHVRRQGKAERVEMEDVTVMPDTGPGPAALAEQRFEVEELKANIRKLSPAQREVISLRFGAGLSTAEVSEALGKNTGTVKALQYNGIVALRKLMTGDR